MKSCTVIRHTLLVLLLFYSAQVVAEAPISRYGIKELRRHRTGSSRMAKVKTLRINSKSKLRPADTCPNPPSPAPPNGGLVLGCSLGETIYISSLPKLPGQGQACYFHCGLKWEGPSNWLFTVEPGGPGQRAGYSPFYGSFGGSDSPMTIQVPSSGVSAGLVGYVNLTAEYSECSAPNNTASSAQLWFGSPAVSNGKVNGNPANSGTVYVPSGYANLNVDISGGGNTNWYITNGSGSLSPSGNYCSVSFSSFVRVVVDASNRCGSGGSWTFYLSTQQGYSGYTIGPNPAKDQVSVIMEMKEMGGELIESVELYNEKSKLCSSVGSDKLKAGKYDKKTIDLDVKSLPRGTYFLHVKMKDNIEKHQITLE